MHQCDSKADALRHAAAQLVWIGREPMLRVADPDRAQHPRGAPMCLTAGTRMVGPNMRHHEIANPHQRIELALGVGEQRQDLVAANGAKCLFIEFGQILAAEKDMTRPLLQTAAEQPNDGANEDGLTGTREADYAENLAGHEIKAHAVEDRRATSGLDSQPTDREYRVRCGRCGGFGLRRGRDAVFRKDTTRGDGSLAPRPPLL